MNLVQNFFIFLKKMKNKAYKLILKYLHASTD